MFSSLKRRRRLTLVVVVAAAAVAAGLGAAAYASIPDAGGTIHACYHVNGQGQVDGSSTLRVIDAASQNRDGKACKKDENTLDWNQQGVPGPQGPVGPQGPQGPQGPEGSGHAYIADSGGTVTIHGSTSIATLSGLPAGNYLVWSPVTVVGDGDDGTNDVCDWLINGGQIVVADGGDFMFSAKDSAFGRADMSGQVTLTSDNSSITVNCDANTGGAEAFSRITALKIGAVN